MVTAEENEVLTQVGPGTPGGEFLRRYWHPVAMFPEISEDQPTKHVRMLGEDLVLFRDRAGRVGLLADHCAHRGASLLYGRVEERGIACAYHGWLYDTSGNVLECPAEPADSKFHLTVKQRAYPVREHYGMHWAYLGPLPAPELPRYDLAEMGPITVIKLTPQFSCNWLQILENHVDQSHVVILHQDTSGGEPASNTTRGFIDDLAEMEYAETPFGIKRRQVRRSGYTDTDLIAFPCVQRIFNDFSIKVPIDDTHTRQFSVYTDLNIGWSSSREERVWREGLKAASDPNGPNGRGAPNGASRATAPTAGIEYFFESAAEGKTPPDKAYPDAHYRMDVLRFQDVMAIETQGPIHDRQNERLGTADRGVVLLREMLKREIEKVQQGLDPIGVVRDPNQPPIETFIRVYIDQVQRGQYRPPLRHPGGQPFAARELAAAR
jgi:5,5'-dehydrodivanillate O-demethylase oxygenase subunit